MLINKGVAGQFLLLTASLVKSPLLAQLKFQERVEEGEIDPHTPLFINITYTKKRPSFRQNSWCAKGRMLPWLGVLIKQYCRRFIPPSLYSLLCFAPDFCLKQQWMHQLHGLFRFRVHQGSISRNLYGQTRKSVINILIEKFLIAKGTD